MRDEELWLGLGAGMLGPWSQEQEQHLVGPTRTRSQAGLRSQLLWVQQWLSHGGNAFGYIISFNPHDTLTGKGWYLCCRMRKQSLCLPPPRQGLSAGPPRAPPAPAHPPPPRKAGDGKAGDGHPILVG